MSAKFRPILKLLVEAAKKEAGSRGKEGGRGKKKTHRASCPKGLQDDSKRLVALEAKAAGMNRRTYEKAQGANVLYPSTHARKPPPARLRGDERIILTAHTTYLYHYIMNRLLVYMPEETHRKLKHYCVDHNRSMAELIRRLVQEFLAKAEKKPKR